MKVAEALVILLIWFALQSGKAEAAGEDLWEINEQEMWNIEVEKEETTDHEAEYEEESGTGDVPEQIVLREIVPDYEEGCKVYDGTTLVTLRAVEPDLPEGIALQLYGETQSPDVGEWQVELHAELYGENCEAYELVTETAEPIMVRVLPRPLTVVVEDAVKTYFTENTMEEIHFTGDRTNPVHVSGFVKDGMATQEMPEGFILPRVRIDEQVLSQASPMYAGGEPRNYEGALTVRAVDGSMTGNPTANYCFLTEEPSEYYHPGSVTLLAPQPEAGLDYTVHGMPEGAVYTNNEGERWVAPGAALCVEPTPDTGFNEIFVSDPLKESGEIRFALRRFSDQKELLAESELLSLGYRVDERGPQGNLYIEDSDSFTGDMICTTQSRRITLENVTDRESGLRSVAMLIDRGAAQTLESIRRAEAGWQETTQISLNEEGSYRVYARMEDMVGNVSYLSGPLIVIDRTAPQLTIRGLEDGSANRGSISPRITCLDERYREGSLKVEFEGYQTGVHEFSQSRAAIKEDGMHGETIRIEDIPQEKQWDDLYTMRVSAEDLSGNCVKRELVFSVNRFGSVYAVEADTAKNLDRFYLTQPEKLIVREVNVDLVTEAQILVSCDDELCVLERDKDYRVEQSGSARTWKEYRYIIEESNFTKEGFYRVQILSKDRAKNHMDNRLRSLNLEFAVDRTAPSVWIRGVKDAESYRGSHKEIEIGCRDNLLAAQLVIRRDGEIITQSEPQEHTPMERTQRLQLTGTEDWQTLEVYAVDGAGNQSEKETVRFYLGEKEAPALKQQAPTTFNGGTVTAKSENDGAKRTVKHRREEKTTTVDKMHQRIGVFFVLGGIFCLGFAVFSLKSAFFQKNLGAK